MNVVVATSAWRPTDLSALFADEPVHHTHAADLPNLLVELGMYATTSQARRAGRTGPIPSGWTELKASKRHRLWIWNPTE